MPAILEELAGKDPIAMPVELMEQGTRRGIPDTQRSVDAAGNQLRAVVGECACGDCAAMSRNPPASGASRGVPNDDDSVVGTGSDERAILRDFAGRYLVRVVRKYAHQATGVPFPNA